MAKKKTTIKKRTFTYDVHLALPDNRRGAGVPTLVMPRALFKQVVDRVNDALRVEAADCRKAMREAVRRGKYGTADRMEARADALSAVARIEDFADIATTEDWYYSNR